jgi:hypothetical protein
MAKIQTVLRIRDFNPVAGQPGIYTIKVKHVVRDGGDIDLFSNADGTEIKFSLTNNLTSGAGSVYKFLPEPFCVNYVGQPQCVAPAPGTQPKLGFQVSNATDNSFVLSIPDLGVGTPEIEYRLFLKREGGSAPGAVTVDPRIKPPSAAFAPDRIVDAGLSTVTLVALAFVIFAVGGFMGWMLAGGGKPTAAR